MRLGLGSALGGLMLFAIATNLPEIAIVTAAAVSGNIGVAVGNILGGIAIQTVIWWPSTPSACADPNH